MSLEAAAGKNPVSHVGKIYNVLARDIAEAIIAEIPEIDSAQCLMVSRIGAPRHPTRRGADQDRDPGGRSSDELAAAD